MFYLRILFILRFRKEPSINLLSKLEILCLFKKISIFSLFFILFGCGNKYIHKIPDLQFSWQIKKFHTLSRTLYPQNNIGEWKYYAQLAHAFLETSKKYNNEAIIIFYSLLSHQEKLKLKSKKKNDIVLEAFTYGYFKKSLFDKKKCKHIEKIWKNLIRAEYFILFCGIITAEMKQKFELQRYENRLSPEIYHLTKKLKTMTFLEKISKNIKTFQKICQQLVINNEDITPPSSEDVYKQEIRSGRLVMEFTKKEKRLKPINVLR